MSVCRDGIALFLRDCFAMFSPGCLLLDRIDRLEMLAVEIESTHWRIHPAPAEEGGGQVEIAVLPDVVEQVECGIAGRLTMRLLMGAFVSVAVLLET